MAKISYYFSHDYGARLDDKIQVLLMDHTISAYGIYWALIEILHEEDEHRINLNEIFIKSFSKTCSTSVEHLLEVVESCIKYELFKKDKEGRIFSDRVDFHFHLISENKNLKS